MARPREFDEQTARDQALQVFWDNGYEATSLSDLIAAMGISKSSFYDTFTSKHQLFIDSMDRYGDTETRMGVTLLRSDTPARDAIATLFRYILDKAYVEGDRRGCFIGNCAVELGGMDAEADQRVKQGFKDLESAFVVAVKRGLKAGDVTTTKPPKAVAQYLLSSLNGVRLMTKTGPNRQAAEQVVDVILAALD